MPDPNSAPSKSLWRAAAIITLVLPVGIIVLALYLMLTGQENPTLFDWARISFGFLLGTLATRVWGD